MCICVRAVLVRHTHMSMMAQVELADYLGGCSYMGATLVKAGIVSPDPSMAQVCIR